MLHVWNASNARATRDIDFLGQMNNELDAVAKVIGDICESELDDGFVFDSKSIKTNRIKEDAEYEGVRVSLGRRLSSAKIHLQIDIGFGDEIHPQAKVIDYPALLKDEPPRLRGYPREAVVAEKFEAMVQLNVLNSRMKDFYDIWFLARGFDFDGAILSKSIRNTFENRKTTIESTPLALTGDFARSKDKQVQWAAFLKRSRLGSAPSQFEEIVEFISSFLLPIAKSLHDSEPFDSHWKSPGPWK